MRNVASIDPFNYTPGAAEEFSSVMESFGIEVTVNKKTGAKGAVFHVSSSCLDDFKRNFLYQGVNGWYRSFFFTSLATDGMYYVSYHKRKIYLNN